VTTWSVDPVVSDCAKPFIDGVRVWGDFVKQSEENKKKHYGQFESCPISESFFEFAWQTVSGENCVFLNFIARETKKP
jgi:hypothetical protein